VRIEVDSENDLPEALYYVRSLCDPSVLIHSNSGDVYVRRDAKPWKHPSYKTESSAGYGTVTVIPNTAKDDFTIYGDNGEVLKSAQRRVRVGA
jgi:hypothetical protein